MILHEEIGGLTPVLLLTTVFCGLVAILFLYGKLTSYLHQRSPEVNKQKLQLWLREHLVRLPTAEDIVRESNLQLELVAPVPGGVQWSNLRIERLLPNTSIPEIKITEVRLIKEKEIHFKCYLQWPDCVPGVELSASLGNEKVTFHLQVDWILMFADCVIRMLPDGGVAISWVQTSPAASALSCMITHPPHLKTDININEPLLENPNTEESEGVSSSIAEGVLQLIKNFKLTDFTVPVKETVELYNHDDRESQIAVKAGKEGETVELCNHDNRESQIAAKAGKEGETVLTDQQKGEELEEQSSDDREVLNVGEKAPAVFLVGEGLERTGMVLPTEKESQVAETNVSERQRTQMVLESKEKAVELIQKEDHAIGTTGDRNDMHVHTCISPSNEVSTSEAHVPEPVQNGQVSESSGSMVPVALKTSSEENQTTSNGYSPSSLTRKWQNSLPVITEPSKEEFSPERDVSEAKQTPSKEEDNKEEKKEDNSTDSSPSSWRRSFHEELEGIKESPPLKPLPSYLRVLTYSDDDLAKEDNKSPDDKHEWSRSTTLSIRSYDTDSPMTDASGHFLSTVVFELQDGDHRKHIVALNQTHATRLRKQLGRYTKLHIYNDHTFTAKHIRGKQPCAICGDKITGLFGKQAYICRDCGLIAHKNCHHKTESSCLRSQVSTLNLIYPENVSSYSSK